MKPQRLRLLGGLIVVVVAAALLGLSLRSSDSRSETPAQESSLGAGAVQAAGVNACLGRTCATVRVSFAGSGLNRASISASCNMAAGASAWDCVKQAIGPENIQSQDFGSGLGIFIVGLYGVTPNFGACSCFWEFVVNGASSEVGVSAYIVRGGDTLEWRIGK